MRIAYILTSLGRGGAERQVISLAERMATRGHQVLLIVLKSAADREWATSLEVIRLKMNKSPLGMSRSLWRGHRLLRNFEPDIVHSHTFPGNMAARAFHVLGSAPVVLSTIHNVYEGGWHRTALYRLTDKLTVRTTAVSEAVAKHQIASSAAPKRKCSVITNGIDSDMFTPSAVRRSRMRASLDVGDQFVWLAAGRLTSAKNYPNLLRAFSLVCGQSVDAKLWIAGEGSALEKRRFHALAQTAGISRSVRWLGFRDDLPALLDAADAFVLSSAWEGMPLVVGEAMAMEKPVVATDVGGVRELLGSAGAVVKPHDPTALADGMMNVMRIKEGERRQLGCEARERIRRRFNIDIKANEWQQFYTELLRERSVNSEYAAHI